MQDVEVDRRSRMRFRVPARALPLLFAALGALTFMPALRAPRFLDDYIHTLMIAGRFPVARSPFNLYDFVGDAERSEFIARGFVPWWAHPGFKLRFLRPLSSSLLWFEQRVLGLGIGMQHLHSFAWWLVCVMAARALFRRVLPERPALLATLAFAFAPCHAIPLAWVANRNALLSLAFGTLALGFQLDFRTRGRAWQGALASALFSLALLSGEYALCFGGYVLAFELLSRGQVWWRRALGLVPFAVPAVGYLWLRHTLGYGTVGSGFYVDPLADPLAFLRIAPFRFASLLAQGWLTLGTDTWFVAKLTREWLAVPACLLAGFVLTRVLRHVYASVPSTVRENAAWLLLGSVLATIPVLSAVPSARLLGVALLGIAVQLALILDYAWFPAPDVPPSPASLRSRARGRASTERIGLCATLLGFLHFVHGPVCASLAAGQIERSAADFVADVAWVDKRLQKLGTSRVVVVRGGVDAFFGPFALAVARGADRDEWTRWDVLSDPGHLLVLRKDKQTLELISPPDESLSPSGGFSLFRDADATQHVGDEHEGADFRLQVLAVGKLGPTRARVTFRDRLGRKRLWLSRQHEHLLESAPPEVGFGMPSER